MKNVTLTLRFSLKRVSDGDSQFQDLYPKFKEDDGQKHWFCRAGRKCSRGGLIGAELTCNARNSASTCRKKPKERKKKEDCSAKKSDYFVKNRVNIVVINNSTKYLDGIIIYGKLG